MELTGKLFKKFDTQEVNDRFTKREFVVEYAKNPMYPQYVLFQLIQDKVSLLDSFEEGQVIEVLFNLRGRSWTSPQNETRYFNSLEAWKLKVVPGHEAAPAKPVDVVDMTANDDDLPF